MTQRDGWAGDKLYGVCDVANWASLGMLVTDCPLFLLPPTFLHGSSVEDRNPRLLSQHPCFAYRLQDRPTNRPEHPDGAVPPEAGTHLVRAGVCAPLCVGVGWRRLQAKDMERGPYSNSLTAARENWYSGGAIYNQQPVTWIEVVPFTLIYAIG